MKIYYLGVFAKDDPRIGTSPNADYIADAFEELGHSVIRRYENDVDAKTVLSESASCDLILTEEARLKGDHWSSKDGKNHIEGYFQKVIDESKIPIVAWLTNIFFGVEPREIELTTNPIFKADIVFSTDGGHQKEFEAAGVNHRCLRQGIHLPEAYFGKPVYPTQANIGFIGSVYEHIWPYRKKLIDYLKKTYGDKFEHFGQRGDVRHENLNNLLATLKIVVGDSVKSPYYWSNRIYEMLGRGAFLIHPMTEGLDKEFIPYKHFIPYRFGDFAGLKEIIDYYLAHDKEREEIRLAGHEYCKTHHTYKKRVEELLRVLKEEKII